MAAATRIKRGSLKGPTVGKKRASKPSKALSPEERKFVNHLAALVGDRAREVSESVGVSHDAVLKWCRGDSLPSLSKWPKLAAALGLKDWRELLPRLDSGR